MTRRRAQRRPSAGRRDRRGGNIAAAVALAAASVLLAAGHAAAQQAAADEGPIVIGQRRQLETVHLDRPVFGLSLEATHGRDKFVTGADTERFRETVLSEVLDARTQGYVLHPNFILLNLEGAFGLTQSESRFNGVEDRSEGTLYEWDARATLLRDRDLPFTLYSRRSEDFIDRTFGQTLQTRTTETGGILDVRHPRFPSRFQASRLDTRQTTLAGDEDFTLTRDAFAWTTSTTPADNQRLTWNYNLARTDQGGVADTEYDTHDARLTHDLTFGAGGDDSLTSTLAYTMEDHHEAGGRDVETFRWTELLRLEHTDDLETRYRYELDWLDFGTSERLRNRGTATFVHRLYDSLTTTGNAGGQTVNASNGADEWETFANLDFDYRKRVPFGALTADLGLGWVYNETDAGIGTTEVINRPATFVDAVPIVILGTNVDPGSILVTDATGTRLFVPGLDYVVDALPDRVEIRRVVGGAIAAGDAVLLDYVLEPLPESTSTTNAFSTGLRYDVDRGPLTGAGAYARYATQDQSIDSPAPQAFVPNTFHDYLVGAEYRRWGLTVGAERQWHDSTVNPFDATRFFGRYATRAAADTILTANTTYTILDYAEPERRVELLAAAAGVEHRIGRYLVVRGDLRWRDERDDLAGRTTGFEQEVELDWRYRQTEFYTRARNARLDSPDRQDEFQFFEIGIRREF